MKKLCILSFCFYAVVLSGGCQNGSHGIEVIIEGDGGFPEEIVGRWVSGKKDYWAFQFEEDGRISWCAIGMGGTEMSPGKVTRFPARHGGEGVFEPGEWTVTYDPTSRELSVQIVVEHFHLDMGKDQGLEGSMADLLMGPVSDDYTVWEADWFFKEELVGLTPEPKKFSDIKEFQFRKKVVFSKKQ